jgi:hypothetical protein
MKTTKIVYVLTVHFKYTGAHSYEFYNFHSAYESLCELKDSDVVLYTTLKSERRDIAPWLKEIFESV